MRAALRWVGFGAGVLVVLGTALSVVKTLIVPRGLTSHLATLVTRAVRRAFLFASRPFQGYEAKDRVLSFGAPVGLLALLSLWLVLFFLGFALVLWPLTHGSLGAALRLSGSSMLTLGIASDPAAGGTAVAYLAATTGLVVIALQIAYLPTLYSAFNRRETLVTLLESRAGAPAWGPEILARHQLVGIVDSLPSLYTDWERWSADVAESHTTYPALINFRSPDPLRSWVLGILAVLDSAALYQALCPSRAPSESRLCLRMGFTCLRDIASAIGIPFDIDPMPDDDIELTFEQFGAGVRRLERAGFPMERSPGDAWPFFRGWRVNYEAIALGLADLTMAPPGPWSGLRSHLRLASIPVRSPVDRRPLSDTARGFRQDRA
jgi:hypothetical protein